MEVLWNRGGSLSVSEVSRNFPRLSELQKIEENEESLELGNNS